MAGEGILGQHELHEREIRPLVGRPVNNRGVWIFGGVMLLAAIGLFAMLEARRDDVVGSAIVPTADQGAEMIASPPALALPYGDTGYGNDFGPTIGSMPGIARRIGRAPVTVISGINGSSGRAPPSIAPQLRTPAYYDPGSPDPPYQPPVAGAAAPQAAVIDNDRRLPATSLAGSRTGAAYFRNPATTVPQGAVIQAVMETALDSNRPGFARAIVSRDVRSFDGSRVLIPRGSRLFGEYKADLAQGQNRAFVQWHTLTRPDGVQIAVDSPAADSLGRTGVKGKVDSHFFERFASSILQSTLDIGVGLATRKVNDGTLIIGLPGSTQTAIAPTQDSIRPTLKVKHGASVSVFVARDLDFSAVDP